MQGFTWSHVAVIALGVVAGIAGAFAPPAGAAALIGMSGTIIGGAVGHAQGSKDK